MRKRSFALLLSLIALTSVLGVTVVGAQANRPAGWDNYSHSNDTDLSTGRPSKLLLETHNMQMS